LKQRISNPFFACRHVRELEDDENLKIWEFWKKKDFFESVICSHSFTPLIPHAQSTYVLKINEIVIKILTKIHKYIFFFNTIIYFSRFKLCWNRFKRNRHIFKPNVSFSMVIHYNRNVLSCLIISFVNKKWFFKVVTKSAIWLGGNFSRVWRGVP
jgi:hypothetical protein